MVNDRFVVSQAELLNKIQAIAYERKLSRPEKAALHFLLSVLYTRQTEARTHMDHVQLVDDILTEAMVNVAHYSFLRTNYREVTIDAVAEGNDVVDMLMKLAKEGEFAAIIYRDVTDWCTFVEKAMHQLGEITPIGCNLSDYRLGSKTLADISEDMRNDLVQAHIMFYEHMLAYAA